MEGVAGVGGGRERGEGDVLEGGFGYGGAVHSCGEVGASAWCGIIRIQVSVMQMLEGGPDWSSAAKSLNNCNAVVELFWVGFFDVFLWRKDYNKAVCNQIMNYCKTKVYLKRLTITLSCFGKWFLKQVVTGMYQSGNR